MNFSGRGVGGTFWFHPNSQPGSKDRRPLDHAETLRKWVRMSQEAIFVADIRGRVVDANPAFFTLIGHPEPEELESLEIPGLMADESQWHALRQRLKGGGTVRDYEFVMRAANQERRVRLCTGPFMAGTGGRKLFLASLVEVGDDSLAQEREALRVQLRDAQKMAALGRFTTAVANNFSNSVVAILGFAELLREEVARASVARAHLEELLEAARHASQLVRRLLKFSRKSEPRFERLAIQTAVADGVAMLRAMLPANVQLRARVYGADALVLGHSGLIQEIMLNLGSNAAQAIGDESGQLEVSLAAVTVSEAMRAQVGELDRGEYVRLSMRDTGRGMDEAALSSAFHPLSTTAGNSDGTGLGLVAVSSAMREHDGALRVETDPGEGTTIDLYFPLVGRLTDVR